MKKLLAIIVMITINITTMFSQINTNTVNNATENFQKENLAVFTFVDNVKKFVGEDERITDLVENTFVNMKRFNIIDRRNIDRYLNEMELQLAGLTEKEVIEIGKIYGYSKAVYGSIVRSSLTYNRGDKDTDRAPSIDAYVEIIIKIVDVSTTKILYSSKVSGTGSASLLFNTMEYARETAMNNAYKLLTENLENKLRSIFKITIKIAEVKENGNVILLAGKDDGIKKGFRFDIYKKPDTTNVQSKSVGSIRVKDVSDTYSIAKIVRGSDIKMGDVAEETLMGNIMVGAFATASYYKTGNYKEIIKGEDSGYLIIDTPKMEYTFGLHAKFGYMGNILTPNVSLGLLFGDAFKTTWGFDIRFNLDINLNIYYEIVRLTITPFVGLSGTFSKIGYVLGNYKNSSSYILNGSNIFANDVMFGGGFLINITYNITEKIGLMAGVGYKFYTKPMRTKTYATNPNARGQIGLDNLNHVPTVNLTGLEFAFSFHYLL